MSSVFSAEVMAADFEGQSRSDAFELFHDTREASPPDQRAIDWLLRQGIAPVSIAQPWSVRVGRAQFQPDGRYLPLPGIGVFVFILAVLNCGILDLVAWAPKTGQIATRLGVGAMLGEGQIGVEGLGTTGPALPIHRTPMNWLRAGRRGVVIADRALAAHVLAGLVLAAEDERHARDLRVSLELPAPTIVVAARAGRSAA